MNAALGSAGIILGFVASLGGIATLGVGLWRRRPKLLVNGRTYDSWGRQPSLASTAENREDGFASGDDLQA